MHVYGFLAATCLLATSVAMASGDNKSRGAILIGDARARVVLPNRPAAGYMVVHNKTDTADALVAARSSLADRIELHSHSTDNGVMRMHPVESISIPANGSAELAPGGHHLMIFGLENLQAAVDAIPVTLVFRLNGEIEATLAIVSADGSPKTAAGKSDHQHHSRAKPHAPDLKTKSR